MSPTTDAQLPTPDFSTVNPPTPILTLPRVIIRPYQLADAHALAQNGNDSSVAQYMTNAFPHPYELHHAEFFISAIALVSIRPTTTSTTSTTTSAPSPGYYAPGLGPTAAAAAAVAAGSAAYLHYALCRRADGAYMGGIGLKPGADVEARTWEVGYWLGAAHRGRGLMAEALAAFSAWAFRTFSPMAAAAADGNGVDGGLLRLEAAVFEGNAASGGVLRRVGYREEGVRRKAVFKAGRRLDKHYYGMLREECPGLVVEDGG